MTSGRTEEKMNKQEMLDRAAALEEEAATEMGYWRRDLGRDSIGAQWAQERATAHRAAAAAFREAAQ